MKRPNLNRLFDSNRFVIVFALLIAVVSWLTVAMDAAQTTVQRIPDVPVNLERQAGLLGTLGLSFIDVGEAFVGYVDVYGPRTVVGQLTAEDFLLTVNVMHVTVPDIYDLRVEAFTEHPGNFEIVGFSPDVIPRVRLDQIETREFNVELVTEGLEYADGFIPDIPRLIPFAEVRVTGPRSDLERVERAVIIVELDEALDRPWAEDVEVTLLDITGNVIDPAGSQLSLDYESLTVQIPVLRVETLPLVLEFQNLPSGFPEAMLRSQMEMSATTITIAGPISTMQTFTDWRLGSINLRSLTPENNWFIFDINLPSEQFVNIDNLQSVAVEFDSQYWDSATFDVPGEDILLTNQPAGYEVMLQTVALNSIMFVGNAEEIAELAPEDIVVEVNLGDRDLVSGLQPHPVRISAPNHGMVWPVDEGNLIVYINVTPPEQQEE